MLLLRALVAFASLLSAAAAAAPAAVFTVDDFATRTGRRISDTEAFLWAWKEACNSSSAPAALIVPNGKTYLLRPVTFAGPCKAKHVTVKIKGVIEASRNRSDWPGYIDDKGFWIRFSGIRRLRVVGDGGTIDGRGRHWWLSSCKINKTMPCMFNPTSLYFLGCRDLKVKDVKIRNSPQVHVVFDGCHHVEAARLTLTSPSWSPNTDGVHLVNSSSIQISNCTIRTGDDCISIITGSEKVKASHIHCGPGHGISIGSLGANRSTDFVRDVVVEKSTLRSTTNGLRIKTWQGGSGYARNIKFRDIQMHNVSNPIIIDQHYCDSTRPCRDQGAAVSVRQISYKNVKGTSASKFAINFNCSNVVHCHDILMKDIHLIGTNSTGATQSSCINAQVMEIGKVIPSCGNKAK